MNGSTIVTIILAATLFVVVVTSVVFYVLRRRRRLHRVFLAGNIVESGYAGYIHHHSSDAKKRPNFHHARPFAVSPTPEDFLEMTEGDAASEKAKRGAGTPPEASPQASPQASPSPPSTEESTVEEELRQDASASPEHCGVYSAPVFHLDVTRLVERHNEHHVQSFDETSLSYAEFDASVSDLTTEDNGRLHREFKSLNRSLFGDQTTDEANHVKNLKRNRYLNVLPYDFNRVKLREDDGDGDYINATAIKAPNHHGIRYIAAQGPIGEDEPGRESTVVDFWRMIWEQRVECIVMLTDCVERRKIKCAMYWPEHAGEGISVGGQLDVHLYCVTEDEICFQRELHVSSNGETRKILQWHFKNWPDAEAPVNRGDLLEFVRAIRETRPSDPVLVHCSAGVGRTGVFITLDILLERVDDFKTPCVNVFECVHALRAQRCEMVKNEEQYVSIYSTLLLAIRQRNRHVAETHEEKMTEIDI